jgi:putative OPT family oligopeptide transporter
VGASPWKQQVALLVGVVAGSLVIPLVLNILNHSNGFPGDPNRHAVMDHPLAAPQATLISSIATGVLSGKLPWPDILIGMGLGAAFCVIDEILGLLKLMRLPPLAIGIGIYLPMSATAAVTLGSVVGTIYNRLVAKGPNPEMAKRFGVLLASGLIVGESMLGVLNAAVVAASNNASPFAIVGAAFATPSLYVGLALFVALTAGIYVWTARQARGVS